MANLYLTEQNSILRKTGDRLIVQKGDEILLDVQCHKIDAVLILAMSSSPRRPCMSFLSTV